MHQEIFSVTVPEQHAGKRLDQVLALLCPQHSRARLQTWIRNGFVTVDGASLRQKDTVRGGQSIEVRAQITSQNEKWTGQEIPIDVIHEDEAVLVVNKAPGIIVHPVQVTRTARWSMPCCITVPNLHTSRGQE